MHYFDPFFIHRDAIVPLERKIGQLRVEMQELRLDHEESLSIVSRDYYHLVFLIRNNYVIYPIKTYKRESSWKCRIKMAESTIPEKNKCRLSKCFFNGNSSKMCKLKCRKLFAINVHNVPPTKYSFACNSRLQSINAKIVLKFPQKFWKR